MDVGVIILIAVVVIALVAAAAYYAHLEAKKHEEALRALARELGFEFEPARDDSHDERYAQFEVFRRGHSRYAYNTLIGTVRIDARPFPCTTGDFTYKVTRSNGKTTSTTTYRFSYLIVKLPLVAVPDLLIRRESVMDKLAGVFGFDDIDFESSEFSRKFHVKSPDKRFAYDVVHPRMIEFLMSSHPPVIDIEHGECCVTDGQSRWTPEVFRERLGWAVRFFDLWPDHLTTDLESRVRSEGRG